MSPGEMASRQPLLSHMVVNGLSVDSSPTCSLCRFDDFDGAAPAPANTAVRFRTLHAVPVSRHVLMCCKPSGCEYLCPPG